MSEVETVRKAKDRPILFNAEMIRALSAGKKTQTRRVVKLTENWPSEKISGWEVNHRDNWNATSPDYDFPVLINWHCPYGVAGDRLWVRETWRRAPEHLPDGIEYRADNILRYFDDESRDVQMLADSLPRDSVWRPSIFMPRWASRFLLDVTSARIERLRDITNEDAEAEGVEQSETRRSLGIPFYRGSKRWRILPRDAYFDLWDSINGKRSNGMYDSAANPWVWIIDFKVRG